MLIIGLSALEHHLQFFAQTDRAMFISTALEGESSLINGHLAFIKNGAFLWNSKFSFNMSLMVCGEQCRQPCDMYPSQYWWWYSQYSLHRWHSSHIHCTINYSNIHHTNKPCEVKLKYIISLPPGNITFLNTTGNPVNRYTCTISGNPFSPELWTDMSFSHLHHISLWHSKQGVAGMLKVLHKPCTIKRMNMLCAFSVILSKSRYTTFSNVFSIIPFPL